MTKERAMAAIDGAVDDQIRLLFKVFHLDSLREADGVKKFAAEIDRLRRNEDAARKLIDAAFPE